MNFIKTASDNKPLKSQLNRTLLRQKISGVYHYEMLRNSNLSWDKLTQQNAEFTILPLTTDIDKINTVQLFTSFDTKTSILVAKSVNSANIDYLQLSVMGITSPSFQETKSLIIQLFNILNNLGFTLEETYSPTLADFCMNVAAIKLTRKNNTAIIKWKYN